MSFKEDVLQYVREIALPQWRKANERRDHYIPRTLVPAKDGKDKDGQKDQNDQVAELLQSAVEVHDAEIVQMPKVCILGRAGAGKSYVLAHAYGRALRRFHEADGDAPLPLRINCSANVLPSSKDIRDALRNSTNGLFDRIARVIDVDAHPVRAMGIVLSIVTTLGFLLGAPFVL